MQRRTAALFSWDDNQTRLFSDDTPIPKGIVFSDIDGVLTNNQIFYGPRETDRMIAYSTFDGQGIANLKNQNIMVVLITQARKTPHLQRAFDLNIPIFSCDRRQTSKGKVVEGVLSLAHMIKGATIEHIISIGNDVNDIGMFDKSNFVFCPHHSHSLVRAYVESKRKSIVVPPEFIPGINCFRWAADYIIDKIL